MEKRNKHIVRYLREASKWLPCFEKQKRAILEKIRSDLVDYAIENPDVDYEDIVLRYGAPKQISSAYIDELESREVLEKLLIRRKILCTVSVAMAAVVILWIGVVSAALIWHSGSHDGYYVERIVPATEAMCETGGD